MKDIDLKQVIYALERQVQALQAQADRMLNERDYGAEFPDSDAERLREAIELIRVPERRSGPVDRRKVQTDTGMQLLRRKVTARRLHDIPYTSLPRAE